MMISSSALKNAEDILKKSQIPSWRLDAEILLAEVLRKDRSELMTRNNLKISNKKAFTFNRYIDRRKKFEPVAYILNNKEFFSLDFFVNKDSLIPRPETELMVEKAVKIFKNKSPNVLDIGTGSGCIIISVLKSLPKARGIGLDISKNAIKVAKLNFKRLLRSCDIGLSTVVVKKKILKGYSFSNITTKEDFVLWLKLSRKYKLVGIDKNLTKWRKLNNSLSSNVFQKISDGFKVYNHYMKFNYIKSLIYLIILSANFLKKKKV